MQCAHEDVTGTRLASCAGLISPTPGSRTQNARGSVVITTMITQAPRT